MHADVVCLRVLDIQVETEEIGGIRIESNRRCWGLIYVRCLRCYCLPSFVLDLICPESRVSLVVGTWQRSTSQLLESGDPPRRWNEPWEAQAVSYKRTWDPPCKLTNQRSQKSLLSSLDKQSVEEHQNWELTLICHQNWTKTSSHLEQP
jgi:hypothetical protein